MFIINKHWYVLYISFQPSATWMHCVVTQGPIGQYHYINNNNNRYILGIIIIMSIRSGEEQEHRWAGRRSERLAEGHRVRVYGVKGYKGGEGREERRLSSGPELTENSPEICLSQLSKSCRTSGRAAKSISCRIWSKSMSSRLLWRRTTIES